MPSVPPQLVNTLLQSCLSHFTYHKHSCYSLINTMIWYYFNDSVAFHPLPAGWGAPGSRTSLNWHQLALTFLFSLSCLWNMFVGFSHFFSFSESNPQIILKTVVPIFFVPFLCVQCFFIFPLMLIRFWSKLWSIIFQKNIRKIFEIFQNYQSLHWQLTKNAYNTCIKQSCKSQS